MKNSQTHREAEQMERKRLINWTQQTGSDGGDGGGEESMSRPTRAGYIFYTSKGLTLKINPVILSLHDLT